MRVRRVRKEGVFVMRASKCIAVLVLTSFLSPAVAALAAPKGARGGPPPVRNDQRRERSVNAPRKPRGPGPRPPRDDWRRDGRHPAHGPHFGPPPPGVRHGYPKPRWDYDRPPRRRHRHDVGKGIAIGIGIFALLAAMANLGEAD